MPSDRKLRTWWLIGAVVVLAPVCVFLVGECAFFVRTQPAMQRARELRNIYDKIEAHARRHGNVPPQSLGELVRLGIISEQAAGPRDDERGFRSVLYYCPVPTLDADGGMYLLVDFHEAEAWRGYEYVTVSGGYLGVTDAKKSAEELIAAENRTRATLGLPPCVGNGAARQ